MNEKNKPVAWLDPDMGAAYTSEELAGDDHAAHGFVPLYTAPPRQPEPEPEQLYVPLHLIRSMQSFRDRLCNDERSALMFEADEAELLEVINLLKRLQKHKCYTAPPRRERIVFPTMLRKMWSGTEVQAWLDEHVNGGE